MVLPRHKDPELFTNTTSPPPSQRGQVQPSTATRKSARGDELEEEDEDEGDDSEWEVMPPAVADRLEQLLEEVTGVLEDLG